MTATSRRAVPIHPACDSREPWEFVRPSTNVQRPSEIRNLFGVASAKLWGAQAASLPLPAACRQHFRASEPPWHIESRQAAETNRLAARAPQPKPATPCARAQVYRS